MDAVLAAAGLTIEAATANTFAGRLDEVERIERMIAMAEAAKTQRCASWTGAVPPRGAAAPGGRRGSGRGIRGGAGDDAQLKHHPPEEDERLGWYPGENDERLNRYGG